MDNATNAQTANADYWRKMQELAQAWKDKQPQPRQACPSCGYCRRAVDKAADYMDRSAMDRDIWRHRQRRHLLGHLLSIDVMPRPYWCRLCKNVLEHPGGNLPTVCPHCEQGAHWSAEPWPQVDYVLTENDCRFLKSLRIAVGNDQEADGA